MFVKFERIKFRNILSYGNAWTEFDFRTGLNLIKAQNGSGKSAIIDALTFVLFGKPYRDIKMNQLVNNINDGNLEVSIEFTVDEDKYEMTRGLKPVKFSMKRNGENLELLSSKRLNQDEIDKLIGIDYNLYRNIVCIASINSKSFLSLSPGEKRSLVESIFNIDVLALMLGEVKKRVSISKAKQKAQLASYDGLDENLKTTTGFYNDMMERTRTFEDDKERKIQKKRDAIRELVKELEECSKHLTLAASKEKEFEQRIVELPGIEREISDRTVRNKVLDNTITETNNKLGKILSAGAVCPFCHGKLCNEHTVKYQDELNMLVQSSEEEREKNIASLNVLDEKRRGLLSTDKMLARLRLNVVSEQSRKANIEDRVKETEDAILELEKSKLDVNLDSYKVKIQELTTRKDELKKELDELELSLTMDEHIARILGETGVRQYFFSKLLPLLNAKINSYLNKFELPLTFVFDDMLNAKITRGRYDMSYEQFSCGEKQRIDMSILLSFYDISKRISNWSCSVLFLDEVLDSGVDESGLDSFISVLNNILHDDSSSDIGIFLISHKIANSSVNFDNIVEITKQQLFSDIAYAERK